MNWHYVINGQQCGPLTDQDFESLVKNGTIRPDTFIWKDGMAEWQTYASVFPSASASPTGATDAGEAVCSECGKIYRSDEVIRHGNSIVCAACKPIFLQKLKEGVAVGGSLVYAGFWIRFGAKFVDGIILRILGVATGMLTGLIFAKAHPMVMLGATMGTALAMNAAYCTFFVGKFGATPGKMAAKVRIVNADGSSLTYGKACGRYFAEILSSLTLMIGYIMAGFDEEKRALHDRICNTRVIRK